MLVKFLDWQPAKGGALPKFGAWDVKDPSAGEGFTMIFQKLSNERKEGGPVHIPRLNTDSPARNDDNYHKQNQSNSGRNNQTNNPVSTFCHLINSEDLQAFICKHWNLEWILPLLKGSFCWCIHILLFGIYMSFFNCGRAVVAPFCNRTTATCVFKCKICIILATRS